VARSEYVQKNPALTESILSVLIRSSEFATAHPGESAKTVATWLGGMKGQTFTEPEVYNSEVLAGSDPSMKYSTDPNAQWREGILRFVYAMRGQGTLMGRLRDSQDQNTLAMLLDPAPSMRAHEDLASGGLLQVPNLGGSVRIGYLPTNHHASLFIAVMQGEEVEGAYGSLQPQGDGSLTPKQASLIFGNRSAAEIHLVPARNGKELMDLLADGTLDLALSGTVPVIQAIDQGVPIGILMPVNTEGSGLVVRNDSPAKDWKSLLKWAQERSDAGEDITIAVPGKGTIQDIMIRYAFNIAEVSVRPTI
jgi:NitT/TauT family transport system substrate-binding protein